MEFPHTDRVIYEENPLAEVVCQIRFPRILSLDENLPAEFQNVINDQFPFVEIKKVMQFTFGEKDDTAKATLYEFSNEDRTVTITVCSEYLSVSTKSYERWEVFVGHIEVALKALRSSYPVSRMTRIGLRYVDFIRRSKLGLSDQRWSDLIKPSALGILAEPEVQIAELEGTFATTTLKIDNGKVTLRYGLAKESEEDEELIFVVDSDFYCERAIKHDADTLEILNGFNRSAGRAFRWFIQQPLHDALKPTPS